MPTESVVFLGHWGHNNPLKRISLKLRRDGEFLLHTTLQFKTQRSEGSIRKKNSSEELFAGRQWVKNPKSGEMDNICH